MFCMTKIMQMKLFVLNNNTYGNKEIIRLIINYEWNFLNKIVYDVASKF